MVCESFLVFAEAESQSVVYGGTCTDKISFWLSYKIVDDATAADGTADGTADGATVEGATIVGTTADVSSPSQLPMPPPRSTSLTLPTVAACVGGRSED